MTSLRLPAVVALAVAAATLAGCTSATPAASAAPLSLSIVSYDAENTPGGQIIDHLAATLSQSTGGAVTLVPEFQAADDEQNTAHLVEQGTASLGLIASRVWDLEGVTTLRPINAPFLIDSTPLLDKVVADDKVSTELMSGLGAAGVSGLAMMPEGLRHPFGLAGPINGVSDFRGKVLRAPDSDTEITVFRALGADPQFVDSGYQVAESEFDQAPANYAVGNVVFWAKADVLVINAATEKSLSPAQHDALVAAARDATQWAVSTFKDDNAMAADFCAQGGKISAFSEDQLSSINHLAAPVTATLQQDAANKAAIDDITALKQSLPEPAPITACPSSSGTPAAASGSINGDYFYTVDAKELAAAGVTDTELLDENAGFSEVVLKDGNWTMYQEYSAGPQAGTTWQGSGGYTLDGSKVTFFWSHEADAWTSATVSVEADGSLAFNNVVEGDTSAQHDDLVKIDNYFLKKWTIASPAAADQSSLDGTYTATVTADMMRKAGITDVSAAGAYTLTMKNGTYHWVQDAPGDPGEGDGTYVIAADGTFRLFWTHEAGDWVVIEPKAAGHRVTFSLLLDGGSDAQSALMDKLVFATLSGTK